MLRPWPFDACDFASDGLRISPEEFLDVSFTASCQAKSLGIIAVALNAGVLLLFMVHLSPQLQAGPLGHLLCDFWHLKPCWAGCRNV